MNPLTPYLLWLKLGAAAVAAALLLWAALTVRHWHQDSLRLSAAEAHAAQVEKDAAQTIAAMKAAYAASQKASEGYQNELEQIRNRPIERRVVRVLVPASQSLPAAGSAASGPDGKSASAGVVPSHAGEVASRDIGSDLSALMLEADKCSAQLRALQDFVRSESRQ